MSTPIATFLANVKDTNLTWEKDDDDTHASSDTSSDEDDDASDEDDDAANDNQDLPENDEGDGNEGLYREHGVQVQVAAAVREGPGPRAGQAVTVPTGRAAVMENLRNHPNKDSLTFRVAQSEERPLVRAEIDWDLFAFELPKYPAADVGDEFGSLLLQGILRMDAPIKVVEEALKVFPRSCVSMDCFFGACQHASDDTVQVILQHTMRARRMRGIKWGMLTFLGDARTNIRHARMLLRANPEAVTDPTHGEFNVSPLDRMISGAFIHGDPRAWVEKLVLALATAEFGCVDSPKAAKKGFFFPFHALMRRLVASDFGGIQFGSYSFINTLVACVQTQPDMLRQVDGSSRLPIHEIMSTECHTKLGISGERKLIKFLLHAFPESAMIPDGQGCLPLRMSIENGWPCYDIIAEENPQFLSTRDSHGNLPIHVALNGDYHARFGVSGTREIVRYLLDKYPEAALLTDRAGRLPLHLALQHGWPCHDILIAAAPQTLETRDITSGLYPFQIAACSSHAKEEKEEAYLRELSLLFELMLEAPLLLKNETKDFVSPPRNGKRKRGEE